jgi:hypothetical protein
MKHIACVLVLVVLMSGTLRAQFKSQEQSKPSVGGSLVRPTSSMSEYLGWLNPDNFSMRHNFSLQYMASSGHGLSLATYTNSMFYQIADPLDVRFDVSLQGSPFGGYGAFDQGNYNRLYLSRADLNYRPWENFRVQFSFRQMPYGFYSPWYYPSPTSLIGDE